MQNPKKKALIVEGDRLSGREAADVLSNAGFETFEVLVHEDPLMCAEQQEPSVIILDMASPGMDGFAIFRMLRESHECGTIPIIALIDGNPANGVSYTQDDFEAAFDVPGPEAIIEKPIDARFFITSVMGVLG